MRCEFCGAPAALALEDGRPICVQCEPPAEDPFNPYASLFDPLPGVERTSSRRRRRSFRAEGG